MLNFTNSKKRLHAAAGHSFKASENAAGADVVVGSGKTAVVASDPSGSSSPSRRTILYFFGINN